MTKPPSPPTPSPGANFSPVTPTLPSIIPRGDGSSIVTPGKPALASTLSPKEFADRFGKSRRSVYRWISEGVIPERFVEHTGLREIRISIEAVGYLRETFRERHE